MRKGLVLFYVLCALLISGCVSQADQAPTEVLVEDLYSQPEDYLGQKVVVEGYRMLPSFSNWNSLHLWGFNEETVDFKIHVKPHIDMGDADNYGDMYRITGIERSVLVCVCEVYSDGSWKAMTKNHDLTAIYPVSECTSKEHIEPPETDSRCREGATGLLYYLEATDIFPLENNLFE
jgi:hypothetical protein